MSLSDFDDTDSTAFEQPGEPQPPTELMGFQRALLVIERLSGDRPNGVAVRQCLEQYHDSDVNRGRLYQNLRELIDEGYVEKRPLDGRANMYRLTETGRAWVSVYRGWVADCFGDDETATTEGEERR
ncbi:PadR family transcriptional regulator [Halococcus sp. AFM35]|uniref:PadR family transcriptional regulator n=1 Tax=Halococcus sp. AFM35 TaxID=3421653 RepID=UPI003EB7C5B1